MYPLTIGMAHHSDFDGLYFTVQSLRLYHPIENCQLVVVDNSPDKYREGKEKNAVARFLEDIRPRKDGSQFGPTFADIRYIPVTEPSQSGTTQTRERIFHEAEGDAVMVMDCHVLLFPESLTRLLNYYQEHPDTGDLLTGPLIFDHFAGSATHFNPTWGSGMWGQWGQAWTCSCGDPRSLFTILRTGGDRASAHTIDPNLNPKPMVQCPVCSRPLPQDIGYAGHEVPLLQQGFIRYGIEPDHPPFEIPGQGLGLFTCRREAWLGFNPHFREFGGEELYIHEKFRKAGRKCLCLPFLRWNHRFYRSGNTPYRNTPYGKCRNYVLGFRELGRPLDEVHRHFVVETRQVTQGTWDRIVQNPEAYDGPTTNSPANVHPAPTGEEPLNMESLFQKYHRTPRDLNEHMPFLRSLAEKVSHITEFSERKESTIALLSGNPAEFVSYNSELNPQNPLTNTLHEIVSKGRGVMCERFTIHHDFSPSVPLESARIVEPFNSPEGKTDLLFLDTQHNYNRLSSELKRFAPHVTRWIVVHDTVSFGERGDDGGLGLILAIEEFVERNPEWFISYHTSQQYGLTVLSRNPQDRPENPIILPSPSRQSSGPGTELAKLLSGIGINPKPNCSCKAVQAQMDRWGVKGMRDPTPNYPLPDDPSRKVSAREYVVHYFNQNYQKFGWGERIKAATMAVLTGLAFQLDPLSPFESLVELAIRNAEEKESKASSNKKSSQK